jgi:protein TonB
MKFFVQTLFCLLIVSATFGQGKIYNVVDEQAEFSGGSSKMYQYLGRNLKYPASMPRPCVIGKLFIVFIVEKNGLAKFESCKNVCPEICLEVEKMIKKMPRWKPAKHQGKIVRYRYTLPVNIEWE